MDNNILNEDINGACVQLGMPGGEAGATSCHKYVANQMALVGEYATGAKCLAHKDISGLGRTMCYEYYYGSMIMRRQTICVF